VLVDVFAVVMRLLRAQYPLYSASITLYGGTQAGYYLDEDTNWGLNVRVFSYILCVCCVCVSWMHGLASADGRTAHFFGEGQGIGWQCSCHRCD
jgi:hypothetical protein